MLQQIAMEFDDGQIHTMAVERRENRLVYQDDIIVGHSNIMPASGIRKFFAGQMESFHIR